MSMEISVQGIETLAETLRRMPQAAARALRRLGEAVKLEAAGYPPEGPWNQPGPYPARWYQRHFGPRWARRDGSIGGQNTSQNLQASWRVIERDAWSVVVGTPVSYAGYVVGEEQARFHADHGWRKLSDVAREVVSQHGFEYVKEEIEREGG